MYKHYGVLAIIMYTNNVSKNYNQYNMLAMVYVNALLLRYLIWETGSISINIKKLLLSV